MGADTWVNLVQHRLPPNTTTPPKKPEPKAAPTSPSGQKSEHVSSKDLGWSWFTRKRQTGPLTFTRPSSLDTGSAAVSPIQRAEEGPSLSRVSSGESWLEVTRDGFADGSSDDLTDLEDTNLVSVAPRSEPRVRSIRITSSSSAAAIGGGLRLDDSDAAPAGSRLSDSIAAPELPSMHRECDSQEPGAGIRMRSAAAAAKDSRAVEHSTEEAGASGSNDTATQGDSNRETEGALSMARVAALCGVAPDSDLFWTFLAGMMLYFMSV